MEEIFFESKEGIIEMDPNEWTDSISLIQSAEGGMYYIPPNESKLESTDDVGSIIRGRSQDDVESQGWRSQLPCYWCWRCWGSKTIEPTTFLWCQTESRQILILPFCSQTYYELLKDGCSLTVVCKKLCH